MYIKNMTNMYDKLIYVFRHLSRAVSDMGKGKHRL